MKSCKVLVQILIYRDMQCESGALSLIVPVSLDCHINKLASDKHFHKYGTPGKFMSENCSYGYHGTSIPIIPLDPKLIIAQILQERNETMFGARRNLFQNDAVKIIKSPKNDKSTGGYSLKSRSQNYYSKNLNVYL